jgi:large-conductance mechanosensitive channel
MQHSFYKPSHQCQNRAAPGGLQLFKRLAQFVLQEPQRINVLTIAAAIIMAQAIVEFVGTLGSAVATPLILLIYQQASSNAIPTREFTLGSAVNTVIGAVVSLALAAIALYLMARWSDRALAPPASDEQE